MQGGEGAASGGGGVVHLYWQQKKLSEETWSWENAEEQVRDLKVKDGGAWWSWRKGQQSAHLHNYKQTGGALDKVQLSKCKHSRLHLSRPLAPGEGHSVSVCECVCVCVCVCVRESVCVHYYML